MLLLFATAEGQLGRTQHRVKDILCYAVEREHNGPLGEGVRPANEGQGVVLQFGVVSDSLYNTRKGAAPAVVYPQNIQGESEGAPILPVYSVFHEQSRAANEAEQGHVKNIANVRQTVSNFVRLFCPTVPLVNLQVL